MKVYKEVQVPAQTVKIVDHYECDRCGTVIPDSDLPFRYRHMTIRVEWGEDYPGDRNPTGGFQLDDCCDACLEHLRAVLVAEGFRLTVT